MLWRRPPERGPAPRTSPRRAPVQRARWRAVGERFAVHMLAAVCILAGIILGGGAVIFGVGAGRWSFGDSIYLALISVSTVGFGELEGMEHVRFARLATAMIVIVGLGAVAYFQSSLTAIVVQNVIGARLKERRMEKQINGLTDHIVVTGAGSTGMHVIEELHASREVFVVIDRDRGVLERISRDLVDGKMMYIVGDATEDAILLAAGITRARGVVAALTEDKDNLFVTLSARSLNASARIVAKVVAADSASKMVRAGANATVSPNMLGGRRLASEIVRPTVTAFIDKMLRERDALRLEEVSIGDGSRFVGKPLWEVQTDEMKLLVVALRVDAKFIYNPEPNTAIEVGSVLVVLGASQSVARLRSLVMAGGDPARPQPLS